MKSTKKKHSLATVWYNNKSQYHNEEGPARIWHDGKSEYWLEDNQYTIEEWQRRVKLLAFN